LAEEFDEALPLLPSSDMDNQPPRRLLHEDITSIVIRVFYDVYNEMAGFSEAVLRRAMAVALTERGLVVVEEAEVDVVFRGRKLCKFRIDLLVESVLVVEVKVRDEIESFNKAQVLHYLKATGLEVGLLLNFGRKPQFARVVYQRARNRAPIGAPANLSEEIIRRTETQEDPRKT
jgi:GxxExxY protein